MKRERMAAFLEGRGRAWASRIGQVGPQSGASAISSPRTTTVIHFTLDLQRNEITFARYYMTKRLPIFSLRPRGNSIGEIWTYYTRTDQQNTEPLINSATCWLDLGRLCAFIRQNKYGTNMGQIWGQNMNIMK